MSRSDLRIRPISLFFSGFRWPEKGGYADRVSVNLVYFQANYLVILLLFLLLVCYYRPIFTIALALSVLGGVYVMNHYFYAHTYLRVFGRILTKAAIIYLYSLGSIVLFLLFGGTASIYALVVSVAVILCHASFRSRSHLARSMAYVEIWHGSTPVGTILGGGGRGSSSSPSTGAMATSEEELDHRIAQEMPSDLRIRSEQYASSRAQFRAEMRSKYLSDKV
eukprot:TRINITY_DN3072_c0_g1_i1.p1 TRINITY_DN3072_c0_g1~~TRINITY_DN3072_c0_g1_i1.p1  ORF type:complete len:232 (+),score=34.01 TRINITY_DN3072_c0_g1_i1:32-697(+)